MSITELADKPIVPNTSHSSLVGQGTYRRNYRKVNKKKVGIILPIVCLKYRKLHILCHKYITKNHC